LLCSIAVADTPKTPSEVHADRQAREWQKALERTAEELAVRLADREPRRRQLMGYVNSPTGSRSLAEEDVLLDESGTTARESKKRTRGSLVPTIIPGRDAVQGFTLVVGAAYIFRPNKADEVSPPSTAAAGGWFTENESRGGYALFKGFFREDTYRLGLFGLGARVNWDYRVLGIDLPLEQEIVGGGGELLRALSKHWFLGPRVFAATITTSLRGIDPPGTGLRPDQFDVDSVILGVRLQRDSRDSIFYPREGSLLDLIVHFSDTAWDSDFSYQAYPLAYNLYRSTDPRGVLAFRIYGRFTFGDVPFFAESMLGQGSDLRGYTAGQIHGRMLFATQLEYRRELFWRLGAVVFAGVGAVAGEIDEFSDADWKPSAGFGLRLTMDKENHLNYRIDFAWGEDDFVVILAVGEAF
jgi:hypothetical protein